MWLFLSWLSFLFFAGWRCTLTPVQDISSPPKMATATWRSLCVGSDRRTEARNLSITYTILVYVIVSLIAVVSRLLPRPVETPCHILFLVACVCNIMLFSWNFLNSSGMVLAWCGGILGQTADHNEPRNCRAGGSMQSCAAFWWTNMKLEGHSVERMYLRQSSSDGWRWIQEALLSQRGRAMLRVCIASIQNVERSLLILVVSASGIPLRTIKFFSILFSSAIVHAAQTNIRWCVADCAIYTAWSSVTVFVTS